MKKGIGCLLAVFLLSSSAAIAAEADVKTPSSAAPAVATVNGVAITRSELDHAIKTLATQNRLPKNMDAEATKKVENSVREQLIATELLLQVGAKQEMKDLDKQVDERFSTLRKRFNSDEEFQKALAQNQLDEKQLRENLRKETMINAVLEKEVASKVQISDAEVKKFYDDNKDKFQQPESVRASHILVGVDAKATDEEKKKAKEKAEALLKKIKDGADFSELAKKESTCPSSQQGGDLGEFGRGQMVPPFEKAAFALKPGEVSDVVETKFGYHIIKLTEKKEAREVPLDQVKDRIRDYLKNQETQKKIGDYIAALKKDAKIELMDLPAEPEKKTEPAKK